MARKSGELMRDYYKRIIESTSNSEVGVEFHLKDNVSNFILQQLKQSGINKTEFAKRLNMKMSQLSRIVNSETNLTLRTIAHIYKTFDCYPSLEYINNQVTFSSPHNITELQDGDENNEE